MPPHESGPPSSSKIGLERESAVYQLQAKLVELLVPLVLRCLTIAILIAALILGWKRQLWTLTGSSIWGSEVQPDTQLALLGVINKILDYLVTNAIEHITLLSLTLWMTREPRSNRSAGADALDYDMREELLKPWIAITNFWERSRLYGWSKENGMNGTAFLRFFITLVVSICLLLQGAAMNTVGLPKARWYPDLWPQSEANIALMTMSTPRLTLTSIGWTNYQDAEHSAVTIGPRSESTLALASASTYVALNLLDSIYQHSPGWSYVVENYSYVTALNTNISASTVQSVSFQTSAIIDMYNNARENGPIFARFSEGMIGTVNLTVPMLTTTCDGSTAGNSSPGRIIAEVPEPTAPNGALTLQIGSDPSMNFNGAYCVLSLRQVLFPFSFWLAYPSPSSIDLQEQSAGFDQITTFPASTIEVANLRRLATQFTSMLPNLDGLLPGSSFSEQLLLRARSLRTTRPGFETDLESLAPAVALTMQYLITTASWNMTPSATENITSFPVRWYVYGSGPRLFWQWAIGAVLGVLILTLSYDVYLILWYRIAPGPWLTVSGMMNAANAVEKMANVRSGCAGVATADSRKVKYFIRDVGNGQAAITDDTLEGSLLEKGKLYGEVEDQHKDPIDIEC